MARTHWRPEKKEIDQWFEKKIQEFAVRENCSAKLTTSKWNNKYIFTEIYKIFFITFATELQEWLTRLVDFQKCWKDEWVMQWTPKLVQQLKKTDNIITRTVDHQVDSVIGGFVMEFKIDKFVSYSEVE